MTPYIAGIGIGIIIGLMVLLPSLYITINWNMSNALAWAMGAGAVYLPLRIVRDYSVKINRFVNRLPFVKEENE